jgi:hypothetical protein
MFICDEETKAYLEEWALSERRTLSNLVEGIVVEAITNKEAQKQLPASDTSAKGSGSKRKGKKGSEDG